MLEADSHSYLRLMREDPSQGKRQFDGKAGQIRINDVL